MAGSAVVDPGLAILISASAAIVALVVNVRSSHKIDRRKHTYSVRQDYWNNERFMDALNRARELYRKSKGSGIHLRYSTLKKSDRDAVIITLDQFEFLSAAIYNGDIDERFMKDCEQSLFIGAPKHFRDFIDDIRTELGQPTAHEALDALALRWTVAPPGLIQRSIEWLLMRPLRKPRRGLIQVDARLRRAWRKLKVALWRAQRKVRRLRPRNAPVSD